MRDRWEKVVFDLIVEVSGEPTVEEGRFGVGGVVGCSSHPVSFGEGLDGWAVGVVETVD